MSLAPSYPSDLAIWIAVGWLEAAMVAVAGLLILKPGGLSEAAAVIGEGDTPEERGLLDA